MTKVVDTSVSVKANSFADAEAVRTAVEQAVRAYFSGELLGKDILTAKLNQLVFSVEGVANCAITAPAADVAVEAGELAGEGQVLDGAENALEELEREAMLDTAEGQGLEKYESLLTHRPVAEKATARRAALAALLRIGGDSFTLEAINDNLRGCGLNAKVSETAQPGVVEVRFPDVPGIPDGFERMREIIEDILPAHLRVEYVYWYITWNEMERRFDTWGDIEAGGHTWGELEKLVK